jgi:hypothetical protein
MRVHQPPKPFTNTAILSGPVAAIRGATMEAIRRAAGDFVRFWAEGWEGDPPRTGARDTPRGRQCDAGANTNEAGA